MPVGHNSVSGAAGEWVQGNLTAQEALFSGSRGHEEGIEFMPVAPLPPLPSTNAVAILGFHLESSRDLGHGGKLRRLRHVHLDGEPLWASTAGFKYIAFYGNVGSNPPNLHEAGFPSPPAALFGSCGCERLTSDSPLTSATSFLSR